MLQSLSPANASERRDSDGGFSLVEIMVALAIFLVAS
ncbi:MAG: prepilin-type N-terminal cleavage/methylation domain-containing protein, partial [Candidatus Nanopelagicales bacterium]